MANPEILLTPDFTELNIAELSARGIRLLGLGVENVFSDYQSTEVRPEGAEFVQALRDEDIAPVLITNNANKPLNPNAGDERYFDKLRSELGDVPIYHPGEGLRGKTHADLFVAATDDFGVPPEQAAHLDDQLKNYKGLREAGFRLFIWTKPFGEHQHMGVRLVRPLESVVRLSISAAQGVRGVVVDGFDA